MGRVRAVVVVGLLACTPVAHAAPGPVRRWTQSKVDAIEKTFKDPVERKHFVGKAGLWLTSLGVGQVIDVALMAHGVPPIVSLSAGFVSSAAPTLAQYPVQNTLAKHMPSWFEPAEHRTGWELAKDSAFSGVVGVAGGAAVSALGSQVAASVPVQKLMMPVLRAGATGGKHIVNLVQWGTSQYANQKVSDASDKAREHVGRLGDHIRKTMLPAH